jgi:hypothetical protein
MVHGYHINYLDPAVDAGVGIHAWLRRCREDNGYRSLRGRLFSSWLI